MTPTEAVLLYLRLVLYPTCVVGFILLALFEHYPNERRRLRRVNTWFYTALAVMFGSLALTSTTRLILSPVDFLSLTNYTITPPLIILVIAIFAKLYIASRTVPPQMREQVFNFP